VSVTLANCLTRYFRSEQALLALSYSIGSSPNVQFSFASIYLRSPIFAIPFSALDCDRSRLYFAPCRDIISPDQRLESSALCENFVRLSSSALNLSRSLFTLTCSVQHAEYCWAMPVPSTYIARAIVLLCSFHIVFLSSSLSKHSPTTKTREQMYSRQGRRAWRSEEGEGELQCRYTEGEEGW